MNHRRVLWVLTLCAVLATLATGSAANASVRPGFRVARTVPDFPVARTVPDFRVARTGEGGYHEVYVWSPGPFGVALGEASLSSQDFDGRTVRRLLLCAAVAVKTPVAALVAVPDGRELGYPAPPPGSAPRCFARELGYPIATWRLRLGAGISTRVEPPPLV
jgi:hypothetical protein